MRLATQAAMKKVQGRLWVALIGVAVLVTATAFGYQELRLGEVDGASATEFTESTTPSNTSGSLMERAYPDTVYYQDPDWREGQLGEGSGPATPSLFSQKVNTLLPDTPYYQDPDWREGQPGAGELSQSAHNPPTAGVSSMKLNGEAFRIMEEHRAADREADFQDMLRYWDQLKQQE